MKIVCAPDSFKESLTAAQVAAAMARGVQRALPDAMCDVCPVGDGGEGTLDALVAAMDGQMHQKTVRGPLGPPVLATFGVCSRTGIVELASAAGLALVHPSLRNPMLTSTLGVGELIQAAIDKGCETIIVCIGGSATVDGGTAIAQALGAKFYDRNGQIILDPMTGGRLREVSRIVPTHGLPPIRVACDVTNPLLGPAGAATIYGPQKGATPAQVRELEAGLAHLAAIAGGDPHVPGAGAAGGAGFGLMALCGAKLERGIDLVLNAVRFEERCRDARLVLTGEGRLDAQSLQGKACMGVAMAAAKLGVPTIAIVGSTGDGARECTDPSKGGLLRSYISLADRFGIDRAMSETAMLISEIAEQIIRQQCLAVGES